MKVHEKIRLLREVHQLSQEDMADKLGMSVSGYAKIERGETRSNMTRLEQISRVLNMDIFELLSYGEDGKLSLTNSNNNLNHAFVSIGHANIDQEILRLQLIVSHKNEIIDNLNNEIVALKEIIALLKNKNS